MALWNEGMDQSNRDMMARFEREAHSFVIRIWRENRDILGEKAEWRGWIVHTQSGQRYYFREIGEIDEIVAGFLSSVTK